MKRKIVIVDTCVLAVHLNLPGYLRCGPDHDYWDHARIDAFLATEEKAGALFVLPLVAIIETANHIANLTTRRFESASRLVDRVVASLDGSSPWVAFSQQRMLWDANKLRLTLSRWPELAKQRISLADTTIADIAEYYSAMEHPVEILTGDGGLKAMQPPPSLPRRRRRSIGRQTDR